MKKLFSILLLLSFYSNATVFAMNSSEAVNIAQGYIHYMGNETGEHPEWNDAKADKTTKFYSLEKILIAYEVSILSPKEEPQGYIFINAIEGTGVIKSYTTTGQPLSQQLKNYAKEEKGIDINDGTIEFTYLLSLGSMPFALAVKTDTGSTEQEGSALENSDNWSIISPVAQFRDKRCYIFTDNKKSISKDIGILNKEKGFRTALINRDYSQSYFTNRSTGSVDGGKDEFSNIYQLSDTWTDGGDCYSGCGPVAWAILLEYWDRNGYDDLIDTHRTIADAQPYDDDIISLVDSLRTYLGTFCLEDILPEFLCDNIPNLDCNQAATPPWNMSFALNYTADKGYENFTLGYYSVDQYGYNTVWQAIRDNIDDGFPVILYFTVPTSSTIDNLFIPISHYSVIYAYDDGDSYDKISIKTGWGPYETERHYFISSESSVFSIFNLTTTESVGIDITGSWYGVWDWECINESGYECTLTFDADGTFRDSDGDYGTWSLKGNIVALNYSSLNLNITVTVNDNATYMSGSMQSENITGCWSATKGSQPSKKKVFSKAKKTDK